MILILRREEKSQHTGTGVLLVYCALVRVIQVYSYRPELALPHCTTEYLRLRLQVLVSCSTVRVQYFTVLYVRVLVVCSAVQIRVPTSMLRTRSHLMQSLSCIFRVSRNVRVLYERQRVFHTSYSTRPLLLFFLFFILHEYSYEYIRYGTGSIESEVESRCSIRTKYSSRTKYSCRTSAGIRTIAPCTDFDVESFRLGALAAELFALILIFFLLVAAATSK